MRILLLLALISCSNIHIKVKSDYESPSSKGKFEYENSYDLAGWPWLCGFTFWYFGGACWGYNMMPMVPQEDRATSDALAALKEQLGPEATMSNPVVERESWSETKPKLTLH